MNKKKIEKKPGKTGQENTKKRVKVDEKRWPGVYLYELDQRYQGRADAVFTVTYKDPVTGKKVWEKIGKKSEGITPQLCAELRGERTKAARHGNAVKTSVEMQREEMKHNCMLHEIAEAYFKANQHSLKGITTDLNRWELHLKPLFGDRRVSSLSEMDVQRVKSAMRDKAQATIWNSLEMLRRLCNWGCRYKLCPALSFKIAMPKRDNEVVEYLTPEQAARLDQVLAQWKSQDIPRMLRVAMMTGMRRGEIFALEAQDLDWQHSLIRLRNPKGGKAATIPMSPPVAAILREQITYRNEKQPGSTFIFPGAGGQKRVDCSAVKRIKAMAALPERFRIFHGLRHHFAVTLANSGHVDLSLIGQLLTHKSESMTRRYAQYLPETTQAASVLAATLVQGNIEKGQQRQEQKIVNLGGNEKVVQLKRVNDGKG